MANNVVGNYDVVVQVSLAAVDRFLAVMHECGRFLHSTSGYINDVAPPPVHLPPHPILPPIVFTGVEDAFGNAIANQRQIPRRPFTGTVAVNNVLAALRPPIVNPGRGLFPPPVIIPSNLSGIVQLQIFPPTIDVPDASGKNLSATLNAMVRYFPDPNTAPIAQFLRGNLQIVAPINQISTQVGNVIEFDFKASQATVSFTPTYTSNALSIEDTVAINLAIQNALRTSFQPSSATLPSGVSALQFKTLLSGSQKAAALLLDLTSHSSDPSTVQDIVLNAADDFAFVISPDYINSLLSSSLGQFSTFAPISVSEWPFSATYTVTLTSPPPALNFTTGAIQLVINAHAHSSGSIFPSFNFRTVVSLGLNLIPIDVHGRLGAAELVLSKISLDFTDSGLGGDLKDLILGAFKGSITNNIANAVNNTLNSPDPNGIQATVRKQTNIDTQLGNLVNSLLTDPTTGDQPDASLKLQFSYTSVDIEPTAVILRGFETVSAWADPYVEYDQIPPQPAGGGRGIGGIGVTPTGPDYTALNSWIPGGTITQYVWSVSYNNELYPFGVDPDKFVLLYSTTTTINDDASLGASLPPYTPLCLTVQGTRIGSWGAQPATAVSATSCGYRHLPLPLPGLNLGNNVPTMPVIAMARQGANGHIVVTGHAAPQAAGRAAPNLLVHFADAQSAANLKVLTQALTHTKRTDAPTAVMAVVPVGHLEKLNYTPGIIYAENDTAWESAFGLGKAARPLTAIVDPTGKIVWRHEGAIEKGTLVTALTKMLAPTFTAPAKLQRLNVRLGQPAPDFLFEYSAGHELTLSKLKGRRVALVFWHSSSAPSMQAIKTVLPAKKGAPPPLVLAINDGESPEHAHRVLAEKKTSAIAVADPGRNIATAYGVSVWPTMVSIDASGIISGVQLGYAEGEHEQAATSRAKK